MVCFLEISNSTISFQVEFINSSMDSPVYELTVDIKKHIQRHTTKYRFLQQYKVFCGLPSKSVLCTPITVNFLVKLKDTPS